MATLETVLNMVIPWVIAIIGCYLLYRPLKEPLGALGRGIKNVFNSITGRTAAIAEWEATPPTLIYDE